MVLVFAVLVMTNRGLAGSRDSTTSTIVWHLEEQRRPVRAERRKFVALSSQENMLTGKLIGQPGSDWPPLVLSVSGALNASRRQ